MADRRGREQMSFARGVMGPRLHGRRDLDAYTQGCSDALNCIATPEGAARWRGGTRHLGWLRNRLSIRQLVPSMVTTPNGGNPATLADTNLASVSTTTAQSADTWVCANVDFGADVLISAVDVLNYSASVAAHAFALQVQYRVEGSATWLQLGAGMAIYTGATARRFALPPGQSVTARFWRIVVQTTGRLGAISIGGLRFWRERARQGPVQFLPFAYSRDDVYQLVLTDRNVDVFRNGEWQTAVPVPYRDFEVTDVTSVQTLDTLICFHSSFHWQIQRQGDDAQWAGVQQTYTNIPNQPQSLRAQGGENAVHRLDVTDIAVGDFFVLVVEDRETQAIEYTANAATMKSRIENALNNLSHIGGGCSAQVFVAEPGDLRFTVTYQGASGARFYPPTSIDVQSNDSAASVTTVQQWGRKVGAGEDIFGSVTGWPRCGVFFQSRLWLGGPLAQSNAALASKLADFTNFSTAAAAEDARGLYVTLDDDQVITIQHLVAGRYLTAFTNDSEWYVSSRTISGNSVPTFVKATDNGSRQSARPQMVQGGVYYVLSDGRSIGDFVYDASEEDFVTDTASLFAADLMVNLVGLRHRPAHGDLASSLVLAWREDGDALAISVLRSQRVAGAMRWRHADGAFRAMHVDRQRDIWAAVERTVGGVTRLSLERMDPTTYLDAALHVERATPSTVVSGLGHLEGQEVWAWGDGSPMGPVTVSAGAITLSAPAAVVEVGRLAPTYVTTLPLQEQLRDGTTLHRRKRVPSVVVSVVETGAIAVAANGQPPRTFASARFGAEALDVPQADRLLTGDITASSLLGSTVDALVTVSRPVPGPWEVRSLILEVA